MRIAAGKRSALQDSSICKNRRLGRSEYIFGGSARWPSELQAYSWVNLDAGASGFTPTLERGSQKKIILDPFSGSGTTAVVAMNLKRRFIGIELSPEYCQLSIARINRNKLVKENAYSLELSLFEEAK